MESENKAYIKGYNQALEDFQKRIMEHANNGHDALTVCWLVDQIVELIV
jgi:hypothetical protein